MFGQISVAQIFAPQNMHKASIQVSSFELFNFIYLTNKFALWCFRCCS